MPTVVPSPQPSHMDHVSSTNHMSGTMLKAVYAFNLYNNTREVSAEIIDFIQEDVMAQRD